MRLAQPASPHPRLPFLPGPSEIRGSATLQLPCALQELYIQHTHFCLSDVRTSVGVRTWIAVRSHSLTCTCVLKHQQRSKISFCNLVWYLGFEPLFFCSMQVVIKTFSIGNIQSSVEYFKRQTFDFTPSREEHTWKENQGRTNSLFTFAVCCFFTFSGCALAETPPIFSPASYTHGSKQFYKIVIDFIYSRSYMWNFDLYPFT